MTAHRDPDRLIHTFLMEGQTELADQVYDEVRDRIETTRQRAVFGSWRTPDVNRSLKVGLGAAAVVVVAVLGFQFLRDSNTGSPGATETLQPTATPTATPEPSSTPAGLLPPGSHLLSLAGGRVQISVTITAPDWYGERGGGTLEKYDNADAPDGAGLIVFDGPAKLFRQDLYVYGDPCHWETTRPDAPVATVDEAVAALASQALRNASVPVDVTVGGHAGKSITLHVPNDAVFSDCDQGEFRTLIQGPDGARYAQDPGQIDELWILDVNDDLVIIDAGYYEGTPQDVVDELDAIVESARIEGP